MATDCAWRIQKLVTGPTPRDPSDRDAWDLAVLKTLVQDRLGAAGGGATLGILEIGCGTGAVPRVLSAGGFGPKIRYLGIDTDSAAIRRLQAGKDRQWSSFCEFAVRVSEASALMEAGRRFDLVLSVYTLHELAPLSVVGHVAEMLALTAPGGTAFVQDMESLPKGKEEACGLPWSCADFTAVVVGGGAGIIRGESFARTVPVFTCEFRHPAAGAAFDSVSASRIEEAWLSKQLCAAIGTVHREMPRLRDVGPVDDDLAFRVVEAALRGAYVAGHGPCAHGNPCSHRD